MFCPKCGNQNADTNKFCKKCGRSLPVRSQMQQLISPDVAPQHSLGFLGQVLDGKYRIDAKLGSGGMGDVYRATRLLIGDVVAVKILHPHLALDPQAAERFRREAVMATKLRHRNVVGIYDVGISASNHVPYILMEMAEGYTLRQMIKQYGILPLDFVVTVTTQVCSALDDAHSLGIVHRDIKPENIVANQTTTGWYIKVLDFGIAKLYNQGDIGLTQDGSSMGTPQYMSPEQCLGEDLDARSDIYSVGIMLYEMLCGTVPFKSPTASAIAIHQVQSSPRPPRSINAEIHPDVETVVLKALAKQPELRQQKASLLTQELIKAATAAFKSGFTTVPAAPIPAPDIQPEFIAVDEPLPEGPSEREFAVAVAEARMIESSTINDEDSSAVVEGGFDEAGPDEETAVLQDQQVGAPHDPLGFAPVVPPPNVSISIVTELQGSGLREEVETKTSNSTQEEGIEGPPKKRESDLENKAIEAGSVDEEPDVRNVGDAPRMPDLSAVEADLLNEVFERDSSPANDLNPISKPDDDLSLVFDDAGLRLDEIFAETQLLDETTIAETIIPEPQKDKDDGPQEKIIKTSPALGMPLVAEPLIEERKERTAKSKWAWIVAAMGIVLLVFISLISVSVWFYFFSGPAVEPQTRIASAEPPAPTEDIPEGMVLVPGGEFMMGSNKGDEYSRPEHKVTVKPFYMDITEVTNEEYKKFVDAEKHQVPTGWNNGAFPAGKEKFPVTGVNWYDASSYASWAKKRLPTEEEWEFAARGTEGLLYPWGYKWDRNLANAGGASREFREVGQGGTSPFGIYDLSGNAWEWTATDAVAYPGGKSFTGSSPDQKIIRGGSWASSAKDASAVNRAAWGAAAEREYRYMGIRCVRDVQ